MTLLNKPDQVRVREHLARELVAPVNLLTFIDSPTCQSCGATVTLMREVACLSDRVCVEVVQRAAAPQRAALYGVEKTPAIVVLADADGELRDTRMRFFGVRPLHLQVFVTPACPYCPRAVALAHRLALASPQVRADMVEVLEFPELADRYHVHGDPRTVINDTVAVEGAVPEGLLLSELEEAAAVAA